MFWNERSSGCSTVDLEALVSTCFVTILYFVCYLLVSAPYSSMVALVIIGSTYIKQRSGEFVSMILSYMSLWKLNCRIYWPSLVCQCQSPPFSCLYYYDYPRC